MSDTLMVSVSGMRGIVGKDLTPELVARHAAALGAWAASHGLPKVVLGRDARTSGPMFARAATAGLMSVGAEVIDIGVVPTPTLQLAVEYHHAGAGLMLTASHNPVEWNALKLVGPDGIFLDGASGAAVRALADEGPARAGWDAIGTVRADDGAIARHIEQVLRLPMINVEQIRARRFHVALDCVRGAGGSSIPPLLEALGCRVSAINLETDGRFPRAPEPLPENLGELSRLVQTTGADIGMAVDPDVDRLALVDELGVPIGEDYTLAFAVRAVLRGLPAGAPPPDGRGEPLDQPGRGGRCARTRRPVHAGPGWGGPRGPDDPRRGGDHRWGGERRRHSAVGAHWSGRPHRGGPYLATSGRYREEGIRPRWRRSPVSHSQSEGSARG